MQKKNQGIFWKNSGYLSTIVEENCLLLSFNLQILHNIFGFTTLSFEVKILTFGTF